MFEMRPATMADTELLFSWANDAQTRAWSKSTAPIPREDHDRWMQFNVVNGYPSHLVMIAQSDYGSVGVVRFDVAHSDVMKYSASITIAPEHRGKGFAEKALSHACHLMPEVTLDAEIKRGNMRSRRAFERCGFALVEDSGPLLHYRREPLP